MSTYKVLQDIEAEDKLLGPLTLRQFIYAIVAVVNFYFCFLVLSKGAAFLMVIFLPIALFCTFFAIPWKTDQPTEVWALAKIRFFLKPRRRIWDQSGLKEFVTITVPKKIERNYTNGLSQTEVRSRLQALANTIDSRGWAVKNVNVNLYSQPLPLSRTGTSDRLLDVTTLSQDINPFGVQADDDMLDTLNNPVAQQFEQKIAASSQAHRQQIVQQLTQDHPTLPSPVAATSDQAADYWFLTEPTQTAGSSSKHAKKIKEAATVTSNQSIPPVEPSEPNEAEIELGKTLKQQKVEQASTAKGNLRTIQPLSPASTQQPTADQPSSKTSLEPVTEQHNAAILEFANNNDLNVATIARQANKARKSDQPPQDEIVVSLR